MQDSLFKRDAAPLESVQPVSKIVDYIKRVISQNKILAGLRVRGEVSGLSRQTNGRTYFDLKEGAAILTCIAWEGDAVNLPPFKNGDEIIVGGDFGIYKQKSQYQLVVKSIELSGIGMLYAQIVALKRKFQDEGLFDPSRKRPLPEFPRRVAVVSSMASRGMSDFLKTISMRAPFLEIQFIETRVQGEGSQMDIAEAIDRASKLDVDVIVVARGGGSYEDLFPFSLEPVVRAIARSRHPVISAIGHEADHPLSDDVADLRCETPSNAAQYFGQIGDRLVGRIERARTRMAHGARIIFTNSAQRVDSAESALLRSMRDGLRDRQQLVARLEKRVDAASPERDVAKRRERLMQLNFAFRQAGSGALRNARQRFDVLRARFEGANPEAPLSRGYAIVTFDGRAVRDASSVPDGALIEAKVQRGGLHARVEKKIADG